MLRRLSVKPFTINKMYAIVEINGQQFKVEEGKKLFVNHIKDAEEGKTVEFDKVLLLDNDGTVTVVNASGNQVEFKDGKLVVTDQTEPENPNLPNTGSESGQAALAAGLALLALGAGLVATKRRKED